MSNFKSFWLLVRQAWSFQNLILSFNYRRCKQWPMVAHHRATFVVKHMHFSWFSFLLTHRNLSKSNKIIIITITEKILYHLNVNINLILLKLKWLIMFPTSEFLLWEVRELVVAVLGRLWRCGKWVQVFMSLCRILKKKTQISH